MIILLVIIVILLWGIAAKQERIEDQLNDMEYYRDGYSYDPDDEEEDEDEE